MSNFKQNLFQNIDEYEKEFVGENKYDKIDPTSSGQNEYIYFTANGETQILINGIRMK